MAITPYRTRSVSPWQHLDEMNNRLARIFGDQTTVGLSPFTEGTDGGNWVPAVNVEETRDEVLLTAELPGMNRDQVEIEIENNVLTISGSKESTREEQRSDDRRYHMWERRWGNFQRSFTLPRTVKPDGISANFTDGVLEIRMPKAPEAKGRKIEIGSETSAGRAKQGEISSGDSD